MQSDLVLAFDVYGTLVDPLQLTDHLARRLRLAPRDVSSIAVHWRQKQLEYTFRLTAMERYEDFAWVTRRALRFALSASGHVLSADDEAALLAAYDDLAPFPDVEPALARLREAGHELAVLSNGTPAMLEAVLGRSGLRRHFGEVISVDEVRVYKPSPWVYRHAAERLGRIPGAVCLVSSNAFDVIGAQAAGMQAAWINRSREPFDALGPPPAIALPALAGLGAALEAQAAGS